MGWLARLFRSQPAPAQVGSNIGVTSAAGVAVVVTATPRADAAPAAEAEPPPAGPPIRPLISWLFETAVDAGRAPTAAEVRLLAAIDDVLARPKLPPELLPRAASLVPQLIATLRQGQAPVPVLAERIARDPAIAAEVLRLAGNAYYRRGGGEQEPLADLDRAITLLGADGLQVAITRVVLRPLYQAQPGTLVGRVSPRLWEHADRLSRAAASAAQAAGGAAFDGYLAGLLHGTGWTVMCHVLDNAGLALTAALSGEAATRLESRAHRLFGLAAQPWDITPAFSALARAARTQALTDCPLPIAAALRAAHAEVLSGLDPR